MTASIVDRLMAPWPQWRTHWRVWHAWPLGAQMLLLSLGSLIAVAAGSVWVSAEAWNHWWHAQDSWQQTQQDMDALQRQVQQLRDRIAQLQAQPHPAGFALPAWQAWPNDLPPDHRAVLQAWLLWGRRHGLGAQATTIEQAGASATWRGSLPQLLAAWQGLPTAVPRMAVTGFDIKAVADPMHSLAPNQPMQLQLQMQWTVLTEQPHTAESRAKPQLANKAKAESAALLRDSTLAQPAGMQGKPLSAMVHDPFSTAGLKKALPWVALSPSSHQVLPWQTLALSELRWAGMLAHGEQRRALLHAQGRVHTVGVGDRLGQDWGVVTGIGRDHLRLQEWLADTQGKWVSQARRFPMVGPP